MDKRIKGEESNAIHARDNQNESGAGRQITQYPQSLPPYGIASSMHPDEQGHYYFFRSHKERETTFTITELGVILALQGPYLRENEREFIKDYFK